MESKIENGRMGVNALGMPEVLTGIDALLQRAYNRLNLLRGSFRYDGELGCRLPGVKEVTAEAALRFAQEALLPCPEIAVIGAEIYGSTAVVLLSTPLGEGSVTVYLKEEDDDI